MRDRCLNASILIVCFWSTLLFFFALNLHSRETKVQVMEKGSVLKLEPNMESPSLKKEERRPVFGLGISAGYALPSEGIYDGGMMLSSRICFSIVKNIVVEIKGLMYQSSVDEEPEGLSTGKLTVAPIQLSLLGRFPLGEKFVPYTGLGAGYYLSRFKVDNEIAENWSNLGFDIDEKVENTLGFHFVVGVDYFFTQNLALNADISYCSVKPKGSWSLTDQVSGTSVSEDFEDLNLNSVLFGIGLKYFF